jgi:hypothetical protein
MLRHIAAAKPLFGLSKRSRQNSMNFLPPPSLAAIHVVSCLRGVLRKNYLLQPASMLAPDPPAEGITPPTGEHAKNTIEWAYYWKSAGFSALQFEALKNKLGTVRTVIFDFTTNKPNQADVDKKLNVWTWNILQTDWVSFTGTLSYIQPYEFVELVRNVGCQYL